MGSNPAGRPTRKVFFCEISTTVFIYGDCVAEFALEIQKLELNNASLASFVYFADVPQIY